MGRPLTTEGEPQVREVRARISIPQRAECDVMLGVLQAEEDKKARRDKRKARRVTDAELFRYALRHLAEQDQTMRRAVKRAAKGGR